jgi:TolB-like protein
VTTGSRAVFLSYASQDAEAARRIAEALRAAGIEVWFDQSELRGGDAWDQSIRKQIKACALFLPVISHTTHDRREGYFRLEWKLAVDRCHLMDADMAFLLPVVIDDTRYDDERVPERFREVQWTRLPAGETPPAFVERVRRLLSPEASTTTRPQGSTMSGATAPVGKSGRSSKPVLLAAVAFTVLVALAYFIVNKFWLSKPTTAGTAAISPTGPKATGAVPSDKSIAILPFADLSEKKDQEYFADGLADEVLSLLATLPDLNVISRTSSFQFKGKSIDLRTVGKELGAAYIVEGSVRKSGDRVRVTAQLISTQDGAHRWSDTYERNFGDVLRLQRELATSLGRALEVEVGGLAEHGAATLTHPEAYTAYLRGLHSLDRFDETGLDEAIGYFEQALAVDPDLLRARENLARARYLQYVLGVVTPPIAAERLRQAADNVLRLNPKSAMGHALRAEVLITYDWDWAGAQQEANLGLALAKNSAFALYAAADIASVFDRWDEAEGLVRQALTLDPLDPDVRNLLGWTLYRQGRFKAAELEGRRVVQVRPSYFTGHLDLGLYLLAEGEPQMALAEMQQELSDTARPIGVAIALSALGRKAEADAALRVAERDSAQEFAYFVAGAHAFRGETDAAFQWLDRAYVQKDFLLEYIKDEPLLKSLVADPRYKAFLRKMNLPE